MQQDPISVQAQSPSQQPIQSTQLFAGNAKARKAAKASRQGAFANLLTALSSPGKPSKAKPKQGVEPDAQARLAHSPLPKSPKLPNKPDERVEDAVGAKRRDERRKKVGEQEQPVALDAARQMAQAQRSDKPRESERLEAEAKPVGKAEAKKPEPPEVVVIDLRAQKKPATDAKEREPDAKGKESREALLTLDSVGDKPASGPKAAEGAREAGSADFRKLLEARLSEAQSADVVKAAQIVLRDGDSGVIRLKLRPEALGDVKIELNLSDNKITGSIVVSSDEAKSVFEKSMAQLQDAFSKSGFESAKLDVTVDQGNSGSGAREEAPKAFFSERHRTGFERASLEAPTAYGSRRLGAVDILA